MREVHFKAVIISEYNGYECVHTYNFIRSKNNTNLFFRTLYITLLHACWTNRSESVRSALRNHLLIGSAVCTFLIQLITNFHRCDRFGSRNQPFSDSNTVWMSEYAQIRQSSEPDFYRFGYVIFVRKSEHRETNHNVQRTMEVNVMRSNLSYLPVVFKREQHYKSHLAPLLWRGEYRREKDSKAFLSKPLSHNVWKKRLFPHWSYP